MKRNSRPKRARLLLGSTTLSEKSKSSEDRNELDRFLLGRDGSIESMGESGEASEDTPSLPQHKTDIDQVNTLSDASQLKNR